MATNFTWHLGHQGTKISPNEAEYPRSATEMGPPLTAFGNIQFLDAMDMLRDMWSSQHPEITFAAHSEANIADTERGYVIYSTQQRTSKDNNPKPRYQNSFDNESGQPVIVFTQSFIHDVRFTALHKDPRVAEEILEAFEDFMYPAVVVLKMYGVEDVFYHLRPRDTTETRMSKDMEGRAVIYRFFIQRVLVMETWRLEELSIMVSTLNAGATPDTIETKLN